MPVVMAHRAALVTRRKESARAASVDLVVQAAMEAPAPVGLEAPRGD